VDIDPAMVSPAVLSGSTRHILICLLGPFLVLKGSRPLVIRSGGKTEALLCHLALRAGRSIRRDTLLQTLWPDGDDVTLASQALDSLICSVQKLLGDRTSHSAPILHAHGCYRLNVEEMVQVDVASFDALAMEGDRQARSGALTAALASYRQALALYRGDLCVDTDVYAVSERERLRGRYLTLLARLADYHCAAGEYAESQSYARRLLAHDPCREDAHRLVMRCCVRSGERAQALRQYRLCVDILRSEFDALPEPATVALFDQVRRDPGSV
jgi:DNA-binding SARP family transcriptional activator